MQTFANGQVGTSAATIQDGAGTVEGHVCVTFINTGSQNETVAPSLVYQSGTARRLPGAVLAAGEALVLNNVPMQAGIVLQAVTTHASVVDYTVSGSNGGAFEAYSLDANGARKQVNSGVAGNQTVSGNFTMQGALRDNPETGVTAAGSSNTDATGLAAARMTHTVSGADGTKGVKIDNADDVAGTTIIIHNITAGVLKIYPPTGGTLNGGTATTGAFSSASGKFVYLHCDAAGTWRAANFA